jgi:hypothetical protein
MIPNPKVIDHNLLAKLLIELDGDDYFGPVVPQDGKNNLSEAIESAIAISTIPSWTVLGIDIYKYSSYDAAKQVLIPLLFNLLYARTVQSLRLNMEYIFQVPTDYDFKTHFISTGDGGYQILPTPLHGVLFALLFEVNLRAYNSFHRFPKLRAYVGELRLRYCISYDAVYRLDNNFYGTAIINNSRLLGKDTLNRFLIDRPTYDWFMLQMNGIENLANISLDNVRLLPEFTNYDVSKIDGRNIIIGKELPTSGQWIRTVDVQSIGVIRSKQTEMDVYNVHIQVVVLKEQVELKGGNPVFAVSLGNLNTKGIE